jgi:hypothetical protein
MVFTDALIDAVSLGAWVVLPGSDAKFRAFGSVGNIKREWPKHDPVVTGLTVAGLLSDEWRVAEGPAPGMTLAGLFPEVLCSRTSPARCLSEVFGLKADVLRDRARISDLLRV